MSLTTGKATNWAWRLTSYASSMNGRTNYQIDKCSFTDNGESPYPYIERQ
ncbi:hypothetical protein [Buttiauxella sp. JUb87]|nr:hypothetical protein [Buttiauxella sp. JUb87]